MTLIQNSRRSEQGFTLVELAIVMVIIGILIAGILKGQELIANARIGATVTQIKGLDAAMNTFFDKYNARAGLMPNATTRLPGCGTAPSVCANVAATTYGTNFNAPTANTQPQVQVFLHLAAADLISGIDSAGTLTFGGTLPAVRAGGGMWVSTSGATTDLGGATAVTVGSHYTILNGSVANPGGTTGALSPVVAAQIDRKLDDGQPNTGTTQTFGTNCVTGGLYNENQQGATCVLASRVLN